MNSRIIFKIITLFTLFYSISYADDVIFLNGCEIKNVYILESSKTLLKVKSNTGIVSVFEYPNKYTIIKKDVDPDSPSTITNNCDRFVKMNWNSDYKASFKQRYYLLPISIMSFALSWDYISDIKYLPDGKIKDRKIIVASILILAGISNTVLIFTD